MANLSIPREVADSIANIIATDHTRIPDGFFIGAFDTNESVRYPLGITLGGTELELVFCLLTTHKNVPLISFQVGFCGGHLAALGFTLQWSKVAGAVAARRAAVAAVRQVSIVGASTVTEDARKYI